MNDSANKNDTANKQTRTAVLLPELVYPEGLKALKEHLVYGVNCSGFESLQLPDLLRWMSNLLEYNGQFCISIDEFVFRLHLETGIPVNDKVFFVAVPPRVAVEALRSFGKNAWEAVSLYEGSVEKLLEAGLLRTKTIVVQMPKRKGWHKDIPGLSMVRVHATAINNPGHLSFTELIARVRALE